MNNAFKTALLLATLTGMFLVIGQLVGGATGLTIAIIFSVLMNFGSFFWSEKIALAMYKARPATKEDHKLVEMVKRLSKKAKLPMPKVYIVPSGTPNAFATGRSPKHSSVAVTEGIMQLLSDEEIEGVLAHELSHIKHRDILIATIAATIAGVISYIAMMARWAAIFGGFGGGDRDGGNNNIISLIVLAVLAPVMAMIIQFAISRSREFSADAGAKDIMGTGAPLARALEKLEAVNTRYPMKFGSEQGASLFIVNPFSKGAFIKLFATHPPTKDRIKKLRGY